MERGALLGKGGLSWNGGTPWKKWELCGTVGNLFLVTGGTSSYIWVVWNTLINVLILLLKSIFYRLAVFVIKATQTINHENLRNVYKCVKKLTSWWQITREWGIDREIQLMRFALPYDYTSVADGTPFYIELFGFFNRAPQEKYVWAQFLWPVSPIHIFPVGPY